MTPSPGEALPEETPLVEGERFVTAWIRLEKLPGGMSISNGGRYGPIPATTVCSVTTSKVVKDEWAANGMPVLEIHELRAATALSGGGQPLPTVAPESFGVTGAMLTSALKRATPPRASAGGESVPDGWVMVPREPTEEMIKASFIAGWTGRESIGVWTAMLAASPAAPEAKGGGG